MKRKIIGTIYSRQDVNRAVDLIKSENVISAQMFGVYGLWANAESKKAVEKIQKIKNSQSKTLSLVGFSKDIYMHIHKQSVHPKIKKFFDSSETISLHIGSLLHLRMPIKKSSKNVLPISVVGVEQHGMTIQNLDPYGHYGISNLIKKLNVSGVKYVAVTSLNHSGISYEITDKQEAEAFVKNKNIPLLLHDTKHTGKVKGSFTIVDVSSLRVVREGHIPTELVNILFGNIVFNVNKMNKSRYQQYDLAFMEKLINDITTKKMDPKIARKYILKMVHEIE
jgi:tRNA A37 threonylcarbamoyladenosine synthetase subunit TsaC/SUA5/YrdC